MEFPPSTLKDRLSGRVVDGTKPGRPSYLTDGEEAELESYLIKASQVGYGKTRCQVKAIAENIAVDKGICESLTSVMVGVRNFFQGILDFPFEVAMLLGMSA